MHPSLACLRVDVCAGSSLAKLCTVGACCNKDQKSKALVVLCMVLRQLTDQPSVGAVTHPTDEDIGLDDLHGVAAGVSDICCSQLLPTLLGARPAARSVT